MITQVIPNDRMRRTEKLEIIEIMFDIRRKSGDPKANAAGKATRKSKRIRSLNRLCDSLFPGFQRPRIVSGVEPGRGLA